jgi:hypothetical protein
MDKPASDKLVPVAEGGDIGAFSSDAAGRIGKDLGDAAIGVHTLPGQTRTVEIQVGLKAMLRRARAALIEVDDQPRSEGAPPHNRQTPPS